MPTGLRSAPNAALPPRSPATPSPPRRNAPNLPCWSAPPATTCPPHPDWPAAGTPSWPFAPTHRRRGQIKQYAGPVRRFTGRWRDDKAPEDATTTGELVSLYHTARRPPHPSPLTHPTL